MSHWMVILWVVALALGPLHKGPPDTMAPAHYVYLPLVGRSYFTGPPPLLISALFYDTYLPNEPDEAFQIYNPLTSPVPLGGWEVSDGRRAVTFPMTMTLAARTRLWCARRAVSFTLTFGARPECEYGGDTDPAVPDLSGTALQFANTGGRVLLTSPDRVYQDVLVYEGGDTNTVGWRGSAVYPFLPSRNFGEEGQILYRKLDQRTGLPVPDSDTSVDWASETNDIINGRKARYPGWDLERFYVPQVGTEHARLEVLLSPDNAFDALRALLESTQYSIRFEGYTFEHAALAEVIAGRARAGVSVEIMLDGSPPGGISDQQRWVVQQIAQAGGQVYYLRANAELGVRKRYSYQHGKFWVLDGRLALVGSENPSPEAFPDDLKADGTYGRRGVYLVTDAPSVVARLSEIMDADIAPGEHGDVWPWDPADPTLGAPPAGFVPGRLSGGSFYRVQKAEALRTEGTFSFQLIHSPEGALRDVDSTLGLIAQAGAGDTVLSEDLYQHTYWGAEDSNVAADPNPRLEAYIAAARRGATVRVLLDAYFDELTSPRSNLRTVEYLKAVAAAEGLDLQARRRNPTGQGIHNKMVLAQIGGQGWVVVGSLNGGEVSAKLNREMVLKVASDEAYRYLADVFWYDWNVEP